MKELKIHSSLTFPCQQLPSSPLLVAKYFPRDIPQESFFPKLSIYAEHKFYTV